MKKFFMVFFTLFVLATSNVALAEGSSDGAPEEQKKDAAEC
jgi:hypothetical protein